MLPAVALLLALCLVLNLPVDQVLDLASVLSRAEELVALHESDVRYEQEQPTHLRAEAKGLVSNRPEWNEGYEIRDEPPFHVDHGDLLPLADWLLLVVRGLHLSEELNDDVGEEEEGVPVEGG